MPPLLSLQQMRAEYGPPLPLDQQLRRFLEPKIFPAAVNLRASDNILRSHHAGLRLADVYLVGFGRLLLLNKASPESTFIGNDFASSRVHAQRNDSCADDDVFKVPSQVSTFKQNHH